LEKSSRIAILSFMLLGIATVGGLISSSASQYASQLNDPPISELGFTPSGWMGDYEDITFSDAYSDQTHGQCIRIDYSAKGSLGWAGIYWLYPSSNWGELPGKNIEGYKKVTFEARGELGGEKAEFMVGGIDTGKKYNDSIQTARSTGLKTLTTEWKKYEIDLNGADMSKVIGGFCWLADKNQGADASTIYLDNINYE
jgi:hypothetical protein